MDQTKKSFLANQGLEDFVLVSDRNSVSGTETDTEFRYRYWCRNLFSRNRNCTKQEKKSDFLLWLPHLFHFHIYCIFTIFFFGVTLINTILWNGTRRQYRALIRVRLRLHFEVACHHHCFLSLFYAVPVILSSQQKQPQNSI